MKKIGLVVLLSAVATVGSALGQADESLTGTMDKIVAVDAEGWVFNRYDVGSMTNVRVERLADGSADVHGDYTYNGGAAGWVKVHVVGGKLDCLEFWDFPGQCRPLGRSPSQAIVRAFANAMRAPAGH
jgi:hypothetical protein